MPAPSSPIVFEHLPAHRPGLRIAVVTETWPPEVNGVATTLARFVDGLRARHHDIQLIRPRQPGIDDASVRPDDSQVLVNGWSIPRYPALKMGLPARQSLTRLWSTRRPDLVHVVTEGPLGWSALQAAGRLRIPVSSDFRTNFDAYSRHYRVGWLHKPITAYLRRFHNRTRLTMVPTEAIRRELADRGFERLRVVGRGVDHRLFDPARRSQALRDQWGASGDAPVVLHVGRLAPEKNLPALASAFARIRRVTPRARLVLVGEGPAGEWLRAQCPGAVFAGMRAGEDLATHYASGDVFLFPSLTETFGNVTLEAMASGLAVVAYRYAAAAELIDDGHNGLLADYDDIEQLSALATELVAHRRLRVALGHRARERALRHGWEQATMTLEAALLSVAQAGRTDRATGPAMMPAAS
ncbi:MAG: glycosyltransferase family 1 protein [Burkholderiaceae bacterium]